MSASKTCEEYVIAELEETAKKLDNANTTIHALTIALAEQNQKIEAMQNLAKRVFKCQIATTIEKLTRYFSSNIWENYDKDDFDALVELFGLDVLDDPNEEAGGDEDAEEEV